MFTFPPTPGRPLLIGHRGVRGLGPPENTPAAFAAAVAGGADAVELDVRLSADGVLVVHHDAHVGDGAVSERSAAELQALGVATFAQGLAALPAGFPLDVEVKNLPGEPGFDEDEGIVGLVAAALRPDLGRRPIVTSSFSPHTVAALARHLPDVPVGFVHARSVALPEALEVAAEYGARFVCSEAGTAGLDAGGIAAAHERGFAVLCWTVNEATLATRLTADGIDGLFTDDPSRLRQELAA